MTVMDPETMRRVPWDGETMGEIMFRGNITMKGYLKNPTATDEAFAGGWFHSGDLAVMQPDGYVKIKDRSQGHHHLRRREHQLARGRGRALPPPGGAGGGGGRAARPKWGETPCAFVELKPGATATEAELIAHCQQHLARFKAPKSVVFGELPKTSTGKIQKFVLREQGEVGERDRMTRGRRMNAPLDTARRRRCVLRDGRATASRTLTLNRAERSSTRCRAAMSPRCRPSSTRSPPTRRCASSCSPAAGSGFCAGHDLKEMRAHPRRGLSAASCSTRAAAMMLTLHAAAAAGDRARARHRHGGRLPARRDVRPRGRRRRRATFATAGRQRRRVLLDAGGRRRAQHRAQARDGDAADRRVIDAPTALALGPRQPRRAAGRARCRGRRAHRTSSGPRAASVVALGKRAFYEQLDRGLADAYALTGEAMACNMLDPDAAEGIDAFVGKRKPRWRTDAR